MNRPPANKPEPVQPVTVRRHRVDWGASDLDLARITAERAASLASLLVEGAWFLNPRFTVSAPAPTAGFFRAALHARSSWLRTCRETLGTSGQRRLARKVVGEGRFAATLPPEPCPRLDAASHSPLTPLALAKLSGDERRAVIEAGQIAKTLAFSGILFIDGNPIPPRTWQASAAELLDPRADVPVTITRRVDLAGLGATGNSEHLKQLGRGSSAPDSTPIRRTPPTSAHR